MNDSPRYPQCRKCIFNIDNGCTKRKIKFNNSMYFAICKLAKS